MLPNTSIGLNISRTYGRSKEDDEFLTIEELLSSVGKPQVWQQTGSSDKQVAGGSEGNLEGAAKNNGNSVASPEWSKATNKGMYISSIRRRRWHWQSTEKSVPIGDNRIKHCNTQEAQQEPDNGVEVRTHSSLTADEEDEERGAMYFG